jgi:hypothetical protein
VPDKSRSAARRRPTADDALAAELRRMDASWAHTGPTARRQWLAALQEPLIARVAPAAPAPPIGFGVEQAPGGDKVSHFLSACTRPAPGERLRATRLFRAFQSWCAHEGKSAMTVTLFGRALAERGLKRLHSNVNWWIGVELTKSVADFDEEAR